MRLGVLRSIRQGTQGFFGKTVLFFSDSFHKIARMSRGAIGRRVGFAIMQPLHNRLVCKVLTAVAQVPFGGRDETMAGGAPHGVKGNTMRHAGAPFHDADGDAPEKRGDRGGKRMAQRVFPIDGKRNTLRVERRSTARIANAQIAAQIAKAHIAKGTDREGTDYERRRDGADRHGRGIG